MTYEGTLIPGDGIGPEITAVATTVDHLGELEAATPMRSAIVATLCDDNIRTRDLGGDASTAEFGDAVVRRLG